MELQTARYPAAVIDAETSEDAIQPATDRPLLPGVIGQQIHKAWKLDASSYLRRTMARCGAGKQVARDARSFTWDVVEGWVFGLIYDNLEQKFFTEIEAQAVSKIGQKALAEGYVAFAKREGSFSPEAAAAQLCQLAGMVWSEHSYAGLVKEATARAAMQIQQYRKDCGIADGEYPLYANELDAQNAL